MKILELTAFSAGICGLWTRVLAESSLLAKQGHEIHVFSSNIFRGNENKKIAKPFEIINNVKITRFPTIASFGQNTFFWNFKKQALKLKPDVIITHAYRQYYSTKALEIAKKLKIPCFLVTHAPFLEKKLRNRVLNLAVFLYDNFIGKKIINSYNKVIAITKWEIPFLIKIGCKKNKIIHIPNGISDEFFRLITRKKIRRTKKILFLGRIAPIKDIGTLLDAIKILKERGINVNVDLVGPIEKTYGEIIGKLIKDYNLTNVNFHGPIYDLKKKITLIDHADIFVLPSKREALPQALLEAMARGKIVIASKTLGAKELIKDGKNGLLFEISNKEQLSEKITYSLKNPEKSRKIEKEARRTSEQFKWSKLIKKIEKVYFGKK